MFFVVNKNTALINRKRNHSWLFDRVHHKGESSKQNKDGKEGVIIEHGNNCNGYGNNADCPKPIWIFFLLTVFWEKPLYRLIARGHFFILFFSIAFFKTLKNKIPERGF